MYDLIRNKFFSEGEIHVSTCKKNKKGLEIDLNPSDTYMGHKAGS